MSSQTICSAFAPGSVSNVACGFDTLGFALETPWGDRGESLGDRVVARLQDRPGVVIERIEGAILPSDVRRNTAGVAAGAVLERAGRSDAGVALEIRKNMPLCSGLGSSAASAAAAAAAVNALLGSPLDAGGVLRAALAGEAVASGSIHADNVAPALLGGFVLVRRAAPDPDVVSLPVPAGLAVAIVRPHLRIDTHAARSALPEEIPLNVAVRQWSNVGALVSALYRGDLELLSRALEDLVAEPVRARLVPGFAKARRVALDCGALGCSLSGSGPSVFALCHDLETSRVVAAEMTRAFSAEGLVVDELVSTVGGPGARIDADTAGGPEPGGRACVS